MSQQQNSSNSSNGASPSRASANSQPELRLRMASHTGTEPHRSPSVGPAASEGAFGHRPADSEPAGSIPSTLRYRPRRSPGEGSIFCYGPSPSPVDESSALGGGALDSPGGSALASPVADNPPPFLRRRSLSAGAFSPPETMRAVAAAFGFAVGHSVPNSPSPAAMEQRLRDYYRPRSMSCPELLGYDLCTPAMYADLNPNGDWAEYAGYCVFVEVLCVSSSRGPGLSHASGGFNGRQPGSYSPVQGFGRHGAGIFHAPGCYSPSPSSSTPSPTDQSDRELLEPRQFINLFLPRRLAHQQCGAECSCSAYRDVVRCPGPPPQQGGPEDFEGPEDLEDSE